ncbi:methionine synthase [Geodermatophilus sabuli]|uniref:Cobalamin-independent synthase, Catalytic domain n=1 Tax=Geodermatophilus sabuli TaxID=1564158 RepID=A0A285EGW2_9ACTN|nr:methionine synthase [Geodermatophilus sabuli]MBB3085885.1 methionine synthase II (cobalamin-independent) [Geodermatophilus sabuli]SNX98227.1 Cobalamin-independent synthase, Catalytic domain [Geodermatophilus sabuli]
MASPIDPASPIEPTPDAGPGPASWGPATGVGSLPGTDAAEALRTVTGELPDFPHLPELPGRGAGADLVGRGAALLVEIAVELTPAGWRLVPRSGVDQRRAQEFLARDLDALYEVAEAYEGPFKVQVAGPWTLAAGLERTRGDRAVVDPGARRDLGQSLAEGVAQHVAAVTARVPGARVVVQLDEPSVPAVLQGALPTVSGFGKLAAVEASVVEQELAAVVDALDVPVVVHCCANRAPLELFRAAGAGAVSFDLGTVQDLDAIGTAVEAGTHLLPGVVPGTDATLPAPKATASRLQAWWSELGFPADRLHTAVTLTPSCGLAGATPGYARTAMTHVREAARYLLPE